MLLAVIVGLLVGAVVGMLGAGGGLLSMPILVYALGIAPHSAVASSLVIVGASASVSLIPHARRRKVSWRDGGIFGALCVVGNFAGTTLITYLPANGLMAIFTLVLVAVALTVLRQALRAPRSPGEEPAEPRRIRMLPLALTATVTGMLTGLFGVGGGFIVVPALLIALRIDIRRAVGTSLFVVLINSVVGLIARIGTPVSIDWPVVLGFAAASMLGGFFGARISVGVRPRILNLMFATLLILVAVVTGIQSIPPLLG